MVLDEITLHNFGLYHGRQTIRLTPESGKPVVLFGGLNGGGKTTLLDALQLVLYGKFARCSGRGTLSYEEFLRQSISRAVAQEDGAALELELRRTTGGISHSYRIHRYWSAVGNAVRESVEVYVDGVFDSVLTGAWTEQVDEFLPVELSQLFFFDGEKIEALANLENSSRVLRTAIQSLLGIDVVDRLSTDLLVLERRKLGEKHSAHQKKTLERETAELEKLDVEIGALTQSRAALQNELERAQYTAAQVESQYEQQGGEVLERKSEIEGQRVALIGEIEKVEDELRETASGSIPLLMLEPLLESLLAQDDLEQEQITAKLLASALKERDRHLLKELAQVGLAKDILQKIDQVFRASADHKKRRTSPPILSLERAVRNQAESLRSTVLPALKSRILALLAKEEELQKQLLDFDRTLARIPNPEAVEPLIAERARLTSSLADIFVRQRSLDEDLDRTIRQKQQIEARITQQMDADFNSNMEEEETQRILQHSRRARATLERFQTAVIAENVSRIEALVLDCLRHLLRKETLICSLKIDPTTCVLELFGADNELVRPERLSAGERQLLAVALLWGLGRAAGRPLPVIIDTPMGRLDSVHRQRLVERYFPFASHQVLLLSTDEEIDSEQYKRLQPHVSHAYTLEFNSERARTLVQDGYFSDQEQRHAD